MGDHAASEGGTVKTAMLSNRTYNAIKWVAQYLLPGLGAFYATVAGLWGLPNVVEVLGTITALDTLLGFLLGISKKSYDNSDAKFDGTMDISHVVEDGQLITNINRVVLNDTPRDGALTLKVQKQ